jgi:hypothetical protein
MCKCLTPRGHVYKICDSLSKGNGVGILYTRDWAVLRTLTVKSWTDVAEEAAAMLNSANPPAIARRSSDDETAAAAAARRMRGQGGDRGKGIERRVRR